MDNTKDILTQERIDSERRSLKLGGAQYDGIFKSHAALLDRVRELEEVIEDARPLCIAWATTNRQNAGYSETHPVHQAILDRMEKVAAPPIAGKERTE